MITICAPLKLAIGSDTSSLGEAVLKQCTSDYPVYDKMDSRLRERGTSNHDDAKEDVSVVRGRRGVQ